MHAFVWENELRTEMAKGDFRLMAWLLSRCCGFGLDTEGRAEMAVAENHQLGAQPSPRQGAELALVGMLIATTSLSQFFRASTNVIGPELIRDLALTPAMLGFANACFFWALLAIQVPVGILFDRIGARVTVVALAGLAVIGCLMHQTVTDGTGLAAARFLLGLGHGGSFMATVFLISRWYSRARWSTALSWVFALSMIGIACAGTPMAMAAAAFGWRAVFLGVALVQALVGLLFFFMVRDDPPGKVVPLRPPEGWIEAARGFLTILRLPGLLRVLALQTVAYAVLATMMGLWAGPYLHDVHGLTVVERGNVLILMAIAQTFGVLIYGPLDRRFNTRKGVAATGAALTIAVLLALASMPRPPLALAIGLLALLSAVSAYGVVVVSHCRAFYPEALAGRGATTANMAQLLGCALMPMGTGLIAGLWPVGVPGFSPIAYQWIFASIALSLVAGLAIYLGSRDIPPGDHGTPLHPDGATTSNGKETTHA